MPGGHGGAVTVTDRHFRIRGATGIRPVYRGRDASMGETYDYWIRYLCALDDFAEGTIPYDQFRARVLAIQSDIGDERMHRSSTLPFAFFPLIRAIVSAIGEVTPEEADNLGDPQEIARAFFRHDFAVFVCGTRAYTEPESMTTFGPGGLEVIEDGQCISEGVRQFMDFASRFTAGAGDGPDMLLPADVRQLHSIYADLEPDTVLGLVCSQAIQALLPWLREGTAYPHQLATFECQDAVVTAQARTEFRKWVDRLYSRSRFTVRLTYYRGAVLVSFI